MTDDPQGFHPLQPKPEQKKEEKRRIKYFGTDYGTSDSACIITVVVGERIEEGNLIYIDYDGKAYNY